MGPSRREDSDCLCALSEPCGLCVFDDSGLLSVWQCRRKFKGWDGEDEVALERMSKQREWAMLLGSICMILEFFALSANICYGGGAGRWLEQAAF